MSNNLLAINGKIMGMEPMASSGSFPAFIKLWENPNPTVSFGAQTITLSSDDYDFLMCTYKRNASINDSGAVITPKGQSFTLSYANTSSVGAESRTRICNVSAATTLIFEDSYEAYGTTARTVNNARNIPTAIYGFKKNIDISSLITNVSTSADQCMMSDGVTSVEDKLNDLDRGSITITGDGSKTYAQVLDSLFALIDPTKLTSKSALQVSLSSTVVMNLVYAVSDGTAHVFSRIIVDGASSYTLVDTISIKSSGSTWYRSTITTTATYSNRSDNTVGSGMPITLYY